MLRNLTFNGCLLAAVFLALPSARAGDAKETAEPKGGHKAAHGGCLNALGACENGHAEVKLDGDTLKLWFVGGGNDTAKAVRIPDPEVALGILIDGEKDARTIVLSAKPSVLAEEKVGDCSQFVGSAAWIKGVRTFVATGSVTFKGRKQAIRIEYPAGFDPDDDDAGQKK